MAHHAHEATQSTKLCLAGGVALNCVANGRVLRESPFDDIWIQPAAGDAGGAIGAALAAYHKHLGYQREIPEGSSVQAGSYWGPAFGAEEIRVFLDENGYPYKELAPSERAGVVADLLAEGKVVGHFSGRMEFGPRALGARSILGDSRRDDTQSVMNLKIKFRESFRPFAPAVLEEQIGEYFQLDRASPYMLLVAPVQESRRLPTSTTTDTSLREQAHQRRSDIPAVTHVDYSARIQSVNASDHKAFHDVLKAFHAKTGCGVIVNTSFNVRGEPIVCTPQEAYTCFMRTDMDAVVLENFLLLKEDQPPFEDVETWREDLPLD
jgi:carbamoyltransferase